MYGRSRNQHKYSTGISADDIPSLQTPSSKNESAWLVVEVLRLALHGVAACAHRNQWLRKSTSKRTSLRLFASVLSIRLVVGLRSVGRNHSGGNLKHSSLFPGLSAFGFSGICRVDLTARLLACLQLRVAGFQVVIMGVRSNSNISQVPLRRFH